MPFSKAARPSVKASCPERRPAPHHSSHGGGPGHTWPPVRGVLGSPMDPPLPGQPPGLLPTREKDKVRPQGFCLLPRGNPPHGQATLSHRPQMPKNKAGVQTGRAPAAWWDLWVRGSHAAMHTPGLPRTGLRQPPRIRNLTRLARNVPAKESANLQIHKCPRGHGDPLRCRQVSGKSAQDHPATQNNPT